MDEKETCVEVTYLAPYMEEVMKKLEKDKKRSRSAYLPCYAEFFYGLFYERRRSGSGSSRKIKTVTDKAVTVAPEAGKPESEYEI